MGTHIRAHHGWRTVLAGFVAVSAFGGAAGLISGWLRLGAPMTARLPLHSPVFAGLALACVVAVPASVVAVLAWRGRPRDRDAAVLAGVLLTGWIIVEVAVVRQFSPLQVVYGLAGIGLIVSGNPRMLIELGDAVTALPLLATAPLYRRWHLRWGATQGEASQAMPGDDLVPVSHFTATRAITIEARPADVWPWLAQAGYGRGGFYSYDLIDNLGRPSATSVLPDGSRFRLATSRRRWPAIRRRARHSWSRTPIRTPASSGSSRIRPGCGRSRQSRRAGPGW